MPKTTVTRPSLGLVLGERPIAIPERGLRDGSNFRIENGSLTNIGLGVSQIPSPALNGTVLLIFQFKRTNDTTATTVVATEKDIYTVDLDTGATLLQTPREETGTAAASGTAVTGTGTTWVTAGVKAGDQIAFGAAGERDPAASWFTIATVDTETGLTLASSAGTVADGPYTIRKLFSGTDKDRWEAEPFLRADDGTGTLKDLLYMTNNGVDPVVRLDLGVGQAVLLSGLNFRARHLAQFSNMLIYGDIVADTTGGGGPVDKPTAIKNSDVGKPEILATGLAGEFVTHSGADPIIRMLRLGPNLAIYTANRIILTQLVDDPFVFVFRTALVGTAPLSGSFIADEGDRHAFLSRDTLHVFDGATVRPVGGITWGEITELLDIDRAPLGFTHFDEGEGEALWAVPLLAGGTRAYVQATLERGNPVSARNFPYTAGATRQKQGAVDPVNIVGDAAGKLWKLNQGAPAEASFVRTGRIPVADGDFRGIVRRIYPFADDGTGNLEVKVHISDSVDGPSTVSGPFTLPLTLPEGGAFVSPYVPGRYMELEFGGPANQSWRLSGWTVETLTGGRR